MNHRQRYASVGFGMVALALALTSPRSAHAEPEVPLERPAPFNRWCVAPLCQPAAGQAVRAPLFQPPAEVLPSASDGLLERELKQRLGAAVSEQAKKLDLWSKPVDDLSRSAVAALASDRERYEQALGLTGAVVRAALVLQVADALPQQPGCAGSARLSATYEGLAISVALSPLKFPAATHSVSQACVETAQAAARFVDEQALAALVSQQLREGVQRAVAKVKAATTACGPLLQPAALESFADYQRHFAQLQQLRTPELSQNAPECSAALGGPERVELPELDELKKLGLEAANAELVDQALSAAAQASKLHAQLRAQLEELLRVGALGRQYLEEMLQRIAAEWKPQALADEVWGHLVDALRLALSIEAERVSIDPRVVIQNLKDAYGLDEHGVPTLRTLLGFKPTPWVAEANVGLPRLDSDDFRVIGDARLGYQAKNFGFVVRGGIKEFDIDQGGVITQDAHRYGGGDGTLLLGDARDRVRLELRLGAYVDYVDTTVITRTTVADVRVQDYDSLLVRGAGQLGLRLAPTDQLLFRIAAAAGYQYETHDTTNLDTSDVNTGSFESVDTTSARFGGGLLAVYRVVPGVLGARARADLDYYKLTIEQLNFDFAGQPIVTQPQASQLEVSGRIFLDLDLVSFAGFVPAAFAGLDYLSRTDAGPSVTSSTPSFGVGLMRRSD